MCRDIRDDVCTMWNASKSRKNKRNVHSCTLRLRFASIVKKYVNGKLF